MRLATALAALLALLPVAAAAQDRAGRNTPGEWIVDHYAPFGLWDSMCDHRETDGTTERRCYLRYVDVFSPRPDFAAQFAFVTPGPAIEIGIERGTRFDEGGFRILKDGAVTWSTGKNGCLSARLGSSCNFEGEEAGALLAAMRAGGDFAFDFRDRHRHRQSLRWSLDRFDAAMDDFTAEATARGL